ncbi:Lrp/AsnC family transcriptional regulator [Corynebacterium lubricantis]|uniref:Lrp/AsnC family transcriptional regulator n=1 Tax=Corynebacterium lubricantis TaxID=541095 RepID=UPI000477E40B|nr:Lrp/AsnC family transcriptional regulator [Corynebacterium lubricantis]
MDRVDKKILSLLQNDARMTITALADAAHVSVSACHRRLKELERSGVIEGYTAKLSPAAVGLGFQAIVFLTMRSGDAGILKDFEAAISAIPEVTDADRLFGDPDFLVRVSTTDLPAFQKLYDESLTTLPGVLKLTTTLIMKSVVESRPAPF